MQDISEKHCVDVWSYSVKAEEERRIGLHPPSSIDFLFFGPWMLRL